MLKSGVNIRVAARNTDAILRVLFLICFLLMRVIFGPDPGQA
jgi:hypothetical protein